MSLTPAKQRAVNLVERLLSAQAELGRLKVTEEPTVHLSPEQARGAMLLKVLLLTLLINAFPFLLGCLILSLVIVFTWCVFESSI